MICIPKPDAYITQKSLLEKLVTWVYSIYGPYSATPCLYSSILTKSEMRKAAFFKCCSHLTPDSCPAKHHTELPGGPHSAVLQLQGRAPISWFPGSHHSILEVDPTLVLCQLSWTAVDFSGCIPCPHQHLCYFTPDSLQQLELSSIRPGQVVIPWVLGLLYIKPQAYTDQNARALGVNK